jgi:hypothetical protein
MGHHITAIITKLPMNNTAAIALDLPVFIENNYAIIGLDAAHSDYWQQKLKLPNAAEREILLDCATTQYFAQQIGAVRYAIIETDYFGGVGTQAAVVYENKQVIMPTKQGGINTALAVLGVQRSTDKDEFDTIQLGKYRDFSDYFEKYWDNLP